VTLRAFLLRCGVNTLQRNTGDTNQLPSRHPDNTGEAIVTNDVSGEVYAIDILGLTKQAQDLPTQQYAAH